MRRLSFFLYCTFSVYCKALGAYPPLPIDELCDFIDRSRANDQLRFSQEYESIDPGEFASWECSNAECNRNKNRYANVVAYDHSRVILEVSESEPFLIFVL